MRSVSRVTAAGDGRRPPAPSATLLLFAPPRQRDVGATVAVASPVSPPAIVVPFAAAAATAAGRYRFTPQDRAALIALSYALAGWTVAFESDGQGMQWAALCPPGEDGADARYLVGRDGSTVVLLDTASGQVLGRYTTGTALAQDVRRREAVSGHGRQRDDADLGAQSHRPTRHRFPYGFP